MRATSLTSAASPRRAPVEEQATIHSSLVLIGDELLSGHVQDVQVAWLARRMSTEGAPVERVQMVSDHVPDIAGAVRAELEFERPRVVVTIGGLGPTPDDLTYAGVAAALEVPLVHSPVVARFVQRWARTDDCDDDGLATMMRMAMVPEGAHVLPAGEDGPVVAVDLDGGCTANGITVVMLPGVPDHARTAFDEVVAPFLLAHCTDADHASVDIVHDLPEGQLTSCFRLVERVADGFRLGSYPGHPMVLRLSGPASRLDHVEEVLRRHVRQLEQLRPAASR